MADVIIVLAALGMAGMGLYALVTPAAIPAIFGGTAPSADSRNEVRAVYGGFGVAVAALLAWVVLADPVESAGVVTAVAIAIGGMGAGRLVSAAIERPSGSFYPVWFYCVLELVSCGLLLAAA